MAATLTCDPHTPVRCLYRATLPTNHETSRDLPDLQGDFLLVATCVYTFFFFLQTGRGKRGSLTSLFNIDRNRVTKRTVASTRFKPLTHTQLQHVFKRQRGAPRYVDP